MPAEVIVLPAVVAVVAGVAEAHLIQGGAVGAVVAVVDGTVVAEAENLAPPSLLPPPCMLHYQQLMTTPQWHRLLSTPI